LVNSRQGEAALAKTGNNANNANGSDFLMSASPAFEKGAFDRSGEQEAYQKPGRVSSFASQQ
jgi:hypothetical protein